MVFVDLFVIAFVIALAALPLAQAAAQTAHSLSWCCLACRTLAASTGQIVLCMPIIHAAFGLSPATSAMPYIANSTTTTTAVPSTQTKRLSQYNLDIWTTEKGLPNNIVLAVFHASDGFLWIGTNLGITRFDGVTFTTYNSANVPAITVNRITAIYEDRSGALWFASNGGGVIRLKNNVFTAYTTKDGLADNMITSLCEAPLSTHKAQQGSHQTFSSQSPATTAMWIGTARGLSLLRSQDSGRTWKAAPYPLQHIFFKQRVNAITPGANGSYWIATQLNGAYNINHDASAVIEQWSRQNGLPSNLVNRICRDTQTNTLWMGTASGLCKITRVLHPDVRHPSSRSWQDSAQLTQYGAAEGLASNIVWGMYYDTLRRELWLGGSNGIYRLKNGRFESLGTSDGLLDGDIFSITQDQKGNIWFGTYRGGLCRISSGSLTSFTRKEGLAGDVAYAVVPHHDGTLWVGAYGGITHLNPHTGTTRTLRVNKQSDQLASSDLVRCLYKDRSGRLWAGTYGGGLHLWSNLDSKPTVRTFTAQDGMTVDLIRAVHQDQHNRIWIGSSVGVLRYHEHRSPGQPLFTQYTTQHGLPDNSIICLMSDRQGRLWAGFDGAGAAILDSTMRCVRHFTQRDGLNSLIVFFIYEDAQGIIWAGTANGLHRYKDGRWSAITMKQGLPDEGVFQMLEEQPLNEQGIVWIACTAGLYAVRKSDLHAVADGKAERVHTRLYTRTDGMKTSACSAPATPCRTQDGSLWFTTQKGVVTLHPATIDTVRSAPKVFVETVTADTARIPIDYDGKNTTHAITLPAGTQRFDLSFIAPVFAAPERIHFRVMLEGFDKTWVHVGAKRNASYTNLSPGVYTFRVMASNPDGEWIGSEATLRCTIQPFFYQTLWFRILAVICAGAAVYGGFRWRLIALERRNKRERLRLEQLVRERTLELEASNEELSMANQEIHRQNQILEDQTVTIELANTELHEQNMQLEQLNQEKNEFLGIVAHDLKNPLASIRMSAAMLMNYRNKMTDEQINERTAAIINLSERMSTIIINLLDVNAIESGTFNLHLQSFDILPVVQQSLAEYQERAAQKSISMHLDYEQNAAHPMMVFADKQATTQILDNLISNALKYSPHGKRVWVEITTTSLTRFNGAPPSSYTLQARQDGFVCIAIRDEGPGLSSDDQTKLFGKFARLSARPTGGEHSTGLGLSIVKKLAEAMHGTVWCESELGKGATFTVALPMTDQHLHPTSSQSTTTTSP